MDAKDRGPANFINELYGIGDADHDTALESGHIYHLMREYHKAKSAEEAEVRYEKAKKFIEEGKVD
jgi:hypothetical protein